ncbi:hypothetical protein B4113_3183 [Geobacillus sp. B4113_201601]|nr:hypothetical protein B4113_3183 [Geobacillus sp. B4113_201601]
MKDFVEGAPLFASLGNIGGRRLADRAEVAICGSFQRTRLGLWCLYEAVNAARSSIINGVDGKGGETLCATL